MGEYQYVLSVMNYENVRKSKEIKVVYYMLLPPYQNISIFGLGTVSKILI